MVDLPFGSYQESPQQAFRSAARVLAGTGAAAVKLEGGIAMADTIRFLTQRGVPVCGHIGLMPQAVNASGFRAQGRNDVEAAAIAADAEAVAEAGAFALVIEGTYRGLASEITRSVPIPTIGIGASPDCDGQILVTDDVLGLFGTFTPRFVKRYAMWWFPVLQCPRYGMSMKACVHQQAAPARTGIGSRVAGRIPQLLGNVPRRRRLPGIGLLRLAAAASLGSVATQAAVLHAGHGQKYASPSAAIAAAHNGDTVLIAPGTYYNCAIVNRNGLTIAGDGPGVVLTDMTCAGKAILVVNGHNVTVRNLTLTRARVVDENGAGIRAEGHNLSVDNVRFINDQEGILAAPDPTGTITVRNSLFDRNALCEPRCGYDIEVGSLGTLRVVNSTFRETSGGAHIVSAARTTDLIANQLTDAGIRPTAPLVLVRGGALTLRNNQIRLSANARRPGGVLITGASARITVRGNVLHEPTGQRTPLLRNWTGQPVQAAHNVTPAGVAPVSDEGELYHRLRAQLSAFHQLLRRTADKARHVVGAVLRRVM